MVNFRVINLLFSKGRELGFDVFVKDGEDLTLIKKNKLTTALVQIKEGNVSFNIHIKNSVSNQKELDRIQIDYNNVKRDAKILAECIANK